MNIIVTTADNLREVREHLLNSKKIAAIKSLRSAAVPPPGAKTIGLREAKWAVERFQVEVLGMPTPAGSQFDPVKEGMRIIAGPIVKEMKVDFGTGPVTIDIEAMEIKALSQLESLGLEAVGRMLELCEVIKAFSNGHRVGVIEDA